MMADRMTSVKIVAVSAGVGDPSSTRMLVDRILARLHSEATRGRFAAEMSVLELRPLARDIAAAISGGPGAASTRLRESMRLVGSADGIVVATPVYKASYSGLFKGFFDVAEDDLLVGMPVLLAATAGTPRHALVPDTLMRPLFGYLRALPTPTSVFAATEDWGGGSRALDGRIDRAVAELLAQASSGLRTRLLDEAGARYTRTFDGAGAHSARDAADLDFTSDLMRLAAGGSQREVHNDETPPAPRAERPRA